MKPTIAAAMSHPMCAMTNSTRYDTRVCDARSRMTPRQNAAPTRIAAVAYAAAVCAEGGATVQSLAIAIAPRAANANDVKIL